VSEPREMKQNVVD